MRTGKLPTMFLFFPSCKCVSHFSVFPSLEFRDLLIIDKSDTTYNTSCPISTLSVHCTFLIIVKLLCLYLCHKCLKTKYLYTCCPKIEYHSGSNPYFGLTTILINRFYLTDRQAWEMGCFLAKQNSCVQRCSLSLMILRPIKRWLSPCMRLLQGKNSLVSYSFSLTAKWPKSHFLSFIVCSLQLHPWHWGSELWWSVDRRFCFDSGVGRQPSRSGQCDQSRHQGKDGMLCFSGHGWVLYCKIDQDGVCVLQTQTDHVICSGSNILLARLATRKAKPDGQYFLKSEEVDDFIRDLPVTSLPGRYSTICWS